MKDQTVYYINKDGNEWEARMEGSDRPSFRALSKEDVLNKTIEFARNQESSRVIVHKSDGSFQEERTYERTGEAGRKVG